MKKNGFLIGGLIFIALFLVVYLFTSIKLTGNQIISVEEVNNNQIKIENFNYFPYEITIGVGETIEWINLDSAEHTVTSAEGEELNSALLAQGETYSHTFNELGEYEYYCVLHPFCVRQPTHILSVIYLYDIDYVYFVVLLSR